MNKRTPLHPVHESLGARIVDFGGWDMPVQYEGIIPETHATRQRVGLFDIGHMGRVEFIGPQATEALDYCVSCNVANIPEVRVKYGIVTTERGTAIDDVLVYRDTARFHVVVNAGNRDRDREQFRALVREKGFDCTVVDAACPHEPNQEMSLLGVPQTIIALQGPRSEELLQRVVSTETDLSALGYYRMTRSSVLGLKCLISRTGYTGEDGFEVFFDSREAERVWNALMSQGEDLGATPIGLGARDTLRTEAGMPLYGHELTEDITPIEADLGFGVQYKGADFNGKAALVAQKEEGVRRIRVGLELDTRRVAREGTAVLHGGETVGTVTSGTFSPTLGKSIAMAFVPPALREPGTELVLDVRGKHHGAVVVPLPFYTRPR